jgi:hypothetical protein
MWYQFAIWSEAHKKRIFTSGCLGDALRARDERGCLYPYEKLIMIEHKGRSETWPWAHVCGPAYDRDFFQALLGEIEIMERENSYGFSVKRYL